MHTAPSAESSASLGKIGTHSRPRVPVFSAFTMAAVFTSSPRAKFRMRTPCFIWAMRLCVHKAFCFSRGGNVQRDIVALGDEVGQIDRSGARCAKGSRHASTEMYGSYPSTSMPRWRGHIGHLHADGAQADDAQASCPQAPARQTGFCPFPPACRWRRPGRPAFWPTPCRCLPCGEASSSPPSTSSFTALALAPGVLNTTMPASLHLSTGILLTPAPARAIAQQAFRQRHILHGGAAHQNAVRAARPPHPRQTDCWKGAPAPWTKSCSVF